MVNADCNVIAFQSSSLIEKEVCRPSSESRMQFLDEIRFSSQTSSATAELASLLRCHVQCACVPLNILSRPCPKLGSRYNDNEDDEGLLNLYTGEDRYHVGADRRRKSFSSNRKTHKAILLIHVRESEPFSVASVADRHVHRAARIRLVVVDPRLGQCQSHRNLKS